MKELVMPTRYKRTKPKIPSLLFLNNWRQKCMNALSTLCPCSVHALLGDHKALLVWISSNPGGGGATPYSGVLGVVRENLGFSEKNGIF